MIYILLNALPITVATIAGLIFHLAFRAALRRPGGRPGVGAIVTALIAEAWLCAILAGALILAPAKAGVWTMTIGSAFVIWIGFVAPALAVTLRQRGEAAQSVMLECAQWLGIMLIQAVVLRLIGVVPPPA